MRMTGVVSANCVPARYSRPRSGPAGDLVHAASASAASARQRASRGDMLTRALYCATGRLQDLRRAIGQPRAFAAQQRDMAAVRPALEAVDDVGEPRAPLGEVRRVDLRDVAKAYDLGARSGARDQRLHLLGRKVLRLVDDKELVDEGAAAHE